MPLDELATAEELAELSDWLVPAARRLVTYEGRMFGLCNGLDIRALYYNQSLLEEHGLEPPETIEQLDAIASACSLVDADGRRVRFGFLPDPRRLWAWGIVFGGEFYRSASQQVTLTDPGIVAALDWMVDYRRRFGPAEVAAFRQGDQSMPGKTFPLLAGRYAVVMDGQWRVRDIANFQAEQRRRGEPVTQFGVTPLPAPPGGRPNAGWVNGNFFLVPRGAQQPHGAWKFMKFWTGFGGQEHQAAQTCIAGGWIPVASAVSQTESFQKFLVDQPLFATFVELSHSPHQVPVPVVPGAPFLKREVEQMAAVAMYKSETASPAELLKQTQSRVRRQLRPRAHDR